MAHVMATSCISSEQRTRAECHRRDGNLRARTDRTEHEMLAQVKRSAGWALTTRRRFVCVRVNIRMDLVRGMYARARGMCNTALCRTAHVIDRGTRRPVHSHINAGNHRKRPKVGNWLQMVKMGSFEWDLTECLARTATPPVQLDGCYCSGVSLRHFSIVDYFRRSKGEDLDIRAS